mgnify:CR=1 FL=1
MSATQLSVSNRFHSTVRCTRRYSIHITRHVPKYIIVCTHLSINCTPSSGVCGGVQKHSTQIRAIHRQDNGYFFNNRLQFQVVRIFLFLCLQRYKIFPIPLLLFAEYIRNVDLHTRFDSEKTAKRRGSLYGAGGVFKKDPVQFRNSRDPTNLFTQ